MGSSNGRGDALPLSRRALLASATAISALTVAGCETLADTPAQVGARQVAGYDPKLAPSTRTLDGWLKQLHAFGPKRMTGTPNARAFEEWLATQFQKLGCTIERDQFRLTSWDADITDCSIVVKEDGGKERTLDVVAYYPFAASTKGKPAVTGRIVYGGVGNPGGALTIDSIPATELAESIVVIDMPLANGGARGIVKYYPGSYPDPLPELVKAPRAGSQGGRPEMEALEKRCKGILFAFTDVSNEAGRHNYLPFSDKHRTIPALWTGIEEATYLKSVAGKASVTIRCDATLTPDARTDTIVATLPGRTDEVIFITTHTDGPNEVNDNGALGLYAIATYMAKIPTEKRNRTIVFSLPTGHYAMGAIQDPQTGSGRRAGTASVMERHPEVMKRTVAQLQLEQMAAMEWADVDMRWQPTNRPVPENWIATPKVKDLMQRLLLASAAGEDPTWSRIGLVESGQAPGEGGGLRNAGIPGLGMMGSPHYFFRADPKGVLDKLDARVMANQVHVATKLIVLFDRLNVAQLNGEAPVTERDIFG